MYVLPDPLDIQQEVIPILSYVHSSNEMRYYTNHGYDHCKSVLKYIEKIIEICNCNCNRPLNDAEKSILKCSCWLHDLGCIFDRENHAEESVKIIRILCENGHIHLKSVKDEIEYVVASHSTAGLKHLYSLDKNEADENRPISGSSDIINLPFLCALFKLADECDIDRLRAPKSVYDILISHIDMPADSKIWWTRHDQTISVDISEADKKVQVHMSEGGDREIADSLIATLNEPLIKAILEKNKFPCIDCEIVYHKHVDF